MAEETKEQAIDPTSAYESESITPTEEKVEAVKETSKSTTTDWSAIPEDQLSAIIEAKTGIKLEGLAGMKKVLDEVKEDRKVVRAENHALKEFKDNAEVMGASDKKELESIYNKRLGELESKQTVTIQEAHEAQAIAETRMKAYILEAKGTQKLSGLIEPNLVPYVVEDIKKDFGVGNDNNLYRLEDIDGKRVVGKASFDDEFVEWFGQHRLAEFKLEEGIKGSGSRTGDSLKQDGPTLDDSLKNLFGLGVNKPKSVY